MDDGTPEPRTCEICGDPIRPDNKYGICGDNTKLECKKARTREYRRLHPEERRRGRPEPERCSVCGTPIRRNNSVGICTTNPDCTSRNSEAHRRAAGVAPKTQVIIKDGDTFGLLTAIEDYVPSEDRCIWCRCACGNVKQFQSGNLIHGHTKSCGCDSVEAAARTRLAKAQADPYVRKDERFRMLTALEDGPFSTTVIGWRCDCGNTGRATAGNVRRNMNSCGHTRAAALSISKRTHGLSKHPLFGVWWNMVNRCHGPEAAESERYANWGGRGIKVYEPWRTDAAAFITWIEANIGPRPEGRYPSGQPIYTLDRWPDNDGNYEPGNVRWADKKAQTKNRRTVGGVTSQRDAALAEVERLNRLLTAPKRRPQPVPAIQDALF